MIIIPSIGFSPILFISAAISRVILFLLLSLRPPTFGCPG